MINYETIVNTLTSNYISLGVVIALSITSIVTGLVALFGLRYGLVKLVSYIYHADGTTNWLGRHWSWYDQLTYKPYKGYNRLRSRKWNMEHTMQ